MKTYCHIIFSFLIVSATFSAIPKPHRELNKILEKKLSDIDHGAGELHNSEFDHEAFLGRNEAKDFENLSPTESKEKLGKIYDKIDKDGDGFVTERELRTWIQYVQTRYTSTDTDNHWKDFKNDLQDNLLNFESYKRITYGPGSETEEDDESVKNLIKRDERRWNKADLNNDSLLSREEFVYFLHPEDAEYMRDVVVDETIEDIDRNGDGKIDIEEFIRDLWREEDEEGDGSEPSWIKEERDQFINYRDKNKDGFMDRDEVKDWIIPEDYDHSDSEAKHLIQEADISKDGKLTKDEVLEKYDLFVGSQATDFGEALGRHDEF
ncbi:DgyrCDS2117 [Dimorphilus gyrociliatus]|uniref:Reticulocalbin-3 n=1 Tax=Dimorphilus gyrociliatus TaxID=2664684 RepID=A0A7I8VCD8_9ANNE|nr:DgyrCDS2117 [Dimorphilus gyrociliatus]